MSNWPFKSIFVPCFPSESATRSAMEYAAALAAKSGGHVTARVYGLHIAQPFSLASGIAGGYVKAANDAMQAQVDAEVERIKNQYGSAGFVLDVRSIIQPHADLAANVAHHGRLHDIAVTDRLADILSEARAMMEELLFSSGRPAIVVPPTSTGYAAKKIIVGWDGSARAARAVHDAMPMLKMADKVQLICINQEKDPSKNVPGADFAPFLSRHGVNVDLVDIAEKDSAAGDILCRQAQAVQADLIVMGAFGHTRFRQLLLGGATQTMLEKAEVPVFFSH